MHFADFGGQIADSGTRNRLPDVPRQRDMGIESGIGSDPANADSGTRNRLLDVGDGTRRLHRGLNRILRMQTWDSNPSPWRTQRNTGIESGIESGIEPKIVSVRSELRTHDPAYVFFL